MFVHRDAERKDTPELEISSGLVDTLEVESNPKPQAEEAAAQVDDLSRLRATRRIDRLHACVSPGVVGRRIGQQLPDDVGRRRDRLRRTNVQLAQVPTPLSVKRWVPELSTTVTRPERGPLPWGRKVTEIRQLAPAPSVEPQVVVRL